MAMCSDHAPSFIHNILKQERGRYLFPNPFAGFYSTVTAFYACLVS